MSRLLSSQTIDSSHLDVAMEEAGLALDIPNHLYTKTELHFKNKDILEIIDAVVEESNLEFKYMTSIDDRAVMLHFKEKIVIALKAFSPLPVEPKDKTIFASLYGTPEIVVEVGKTLHQAFSPQDNEKATWYFQDSDKDLRWATVELSPKKTVHDEFYPWIRPNVGAYIDRYFEDDSNVLLLLGDPGTGKTSFIRELIARKNRSTMVTHDSELMDKDELYINFITEDRNLLVLEDADVLLHRRAEGNEVMAKLLNAADGLIRSNKKIILTANILHADEIDPALTRPGRCFDILRFRELTKEEANAAADAAGLERPNRPSTLANLFKGPTKEVPKKVGF